MNIKIRFLKNSTGNIDLKGKNYIGIYLFGIRIKKIYLDSKYKREEKKNKKVKINTRRLFMNTKVLSLLKRMIFSVKIKYLNLKLGLNFSDYLLNAYAISIINTIIPFLLRKSSKEIEKGKIYYETIVSENLIEIDIDCIISFSIAKNIVSIIKVLYLILKGGIIYGDKTSNRIVNDNINDLNREYGRC